MNIEFDIAQMKGEIDNNTETIQQQAETIEDLKTRISELETTVALLHNVIVKGYAQQKVINLRQTK